MFRFDMRRFYKWMNLSTRAVTQLIVTQQTVHSTSRDQSETGRSYVSVKVTVVTDFQAADPR